MRSGHWHVDASTVAKFLKSFPLKDDLDDQNCPTCKKLDRGPHRRGRKRNKPEDESIGPLARFRYGP